MTMWRLAGSTPYCLVRGQGMRAKVCAEKWPKKWSKSAPKMIQKWSKNDPKVIQKRHRRCAEGVGKVCARCARGVRKELVPWSSM